MLIISIEQKHERKRLGLRLIGIISMSYRVYSQIYQYLCDNPSRRIRNQLIIYRIEEFIMDTDFFIMNHRCHMSVNPKNPGSFLFISLLNNLE